VSREISPAELPPVPGGWTEREWTFGGERLSLRVPADPDAFLDDPEVAAENERSDYMPYWCHVWPSAIDLTAAILTSPLSEFPIQPPGEVLEIGCGVGLAGLAAGRRGYRCVFSDYDAVSVRTAVLNAARNRIDNATGFVLDWNRPVSRRFDWIVGCEVIYERRNHAPLLQLLDRMLSDAGAAWFADPGRLYASHFIDAAKDGGYAVRHSTMPRQPGPKRPPGSTDLWVLTRNV
jgi:predicted nicotinamide N-methyase